MKFIFLNSLIILNLQFLLSFVILPLKTKIIEKADDYDLISKLYFTSLISTLEIGSPNSQFVDATIKLDKIGFTLNEKSYNQKKSTSFHDDNYTKSIGWDEPVYNGSQAYDCFNFLFSNKSIEEKTKTKFEKIKFTNQKNTVSSISGNFIGMKINSMKNWGTSFINSLKDVEAINSYIWTFEFNKGNEDCSNFTGNLIIGEAPHNYQSKSYSENNLNKDYISDIQYEVRYKYKFDFIKIGLNGDEVKENKLVEFTDSFLNYGTKELGRILNSTFFKNYIDNSRCVYKKSIAIDEKNIYYYACKSDFSEEVKKFPEISFFSKKLNFSFVFDYKDLFIKSNSKKDAEYPFIFLISFVHSYIPITQQRMLMGINFLRKYQLIFNTDQKYIGIYNGTSSYEESKEKQEKQEKQKNQEKQEKKSHLLLIIIIVASVIIVISFILGMLVQKKIIKLPRKARANELEEDIQYEPNNDGDKKLLGPKDELGI